MFHRRVRHRLVLEVFPRLFLFFVGGVELVEDVVEVHLHVAGLDAFGGQRAHGREVVGQTHGGGDRHQLGGGGVAQELQRFLGQGVQAGCCSLCSFMPAAAGYPPAASS